MRRAALLLLLLLAAVNLALVHCSKSNSTAAKLKRCSACQIFVQELHNQMLTSSDTKETILKQVGARCCAFRAPLTRRRQDAMGYKLRVPYAGSTVQVNDILEKVRFYRAIAAAAAAAAVVAIATVAARWSCPPAAVRHRMDALHVGRRLGFIRETQLCS